MGKFLELLEGYSLGDREAMDWRVWLPDVDNGFTVKSRYQALTNGDTTSFPDLFIWSKLVSSEISFFMWLVWWDRIPTLDNLI